MNYQSKLVYAIYRRDLREVTAQLAQLGKKDSYQRTALMHAAITDYCEAIELILKARQSNLELRQQDKEGNTALLLAVQRRSKKAVHLLAPYEYGIRNAQGQFALVLAAMQNDVCMVNCLAERENHVLYKQRTSLMIAIQCSCMDVIPILLMYESRYFCNARSRSNSLISGATVRPSFDVALLEDHEKKPKRMSSSLMIAAYAGNLLAVKYLIQFEKGLQDPSTGETALLRVLDKIIELKDAQGEENMRMLGKLIVIAQTLAQVEEEVEKRDLRGRHPADLLLGAGYELATVGKLISECSKGQDVLAF